MLSIGGITYVDAWEPGARQDATLFGLRAAELATHSASAIEIDYEENTAPDSRGCRLHRGVSLGDSLRTPPATTRRARLTIDLPPATVG
jgi:hypothetical protein